MIFLTNSIFRALTECPARAMAQYEGRILGDATIAPKWVEPSTEAMAAGSLVDAMVTRGMQADETDGKVLPASFYAMLKSSYDDGMKNASLLCNKSGGWNATAKAAIVAAKRLLADPVAQSLLATAILQPRISFLIDDGITWQGDIDILTAVNGELSITDLKSPGKTEDGWIVSQGKNVKCAWYDAWSYWFQLSGYRFGIEYGADFTLNGAQWNPSALGVEATAPVRTGILFASREKVPEIGYVPIGDHAATWEMILKHKTKFGGPSKLEIIKAIATGQVNAPMCGKCNYCKSKSKVVFTTEYSAEFPPFDDAYGLNDLN